MNANIRRQSDSLKSEGHSDDYHDYQDLPRVITAFSRDQAAGSYNAPHSHPRGQFLYASKGLMRVASENGIWYIPPQRGLWIPAGVVHDQVMLSDTRMRTIYVERSQAERFGERVKVIEVDTLLRELILALAEQPMLYPDDLPNRSIVALILHKLEHSRTVPLEIPWPQDRRLAAICQQILEEPAESRTIEQWSEVVGASTRTLIRLFIRETGITYRQWVQQVRVARALTLLEAGEPINRIADSLGFASPSAFSAMFRRLLGESPRDYLERR
ncbi:AraC family transcriptional regulator [Pseudomonas vanderleydeniana]|uniref:Helix-turn-helix transcriptional regulator n=1 Tax=Pseudomonas vanderleydeniana TaxID=2745495 RepID=A0A9E6PQB3_9PSED|nr:helix-turn-helix transcriptional regulator [Pseudomonas vanderleydeniana]QXI30618.1 helix-turn-helix transcriptional regulator [Pseudomonas vanderleydeniana]